MLLLTEDTEHIDFVTRHYCWGH